MGNIYSLQSASTSHNVVINAPFDDNDVSNEFAFDPRSPTVAFRRTPLRALRPDLADCRSPAANRTPLRLAMAGYIDPRSPALGMRRTPLARHSSAAAADNDDEVDSNLTPVLQSRRRRRRRRVAPQPLSRRLAFDDDDDVSAASDDEFLSASDSEATSVFDGVDAFEPVLAASSSSWEIMPIDGVAFDDDADESSDDEQDNDGDDDVNADPIVLSMPAHFGTPKAKLLARRPERFASPACRLQPMPISMAQLSASLTPTKQASLASGFVHRARIAVQDRLVASCPASPKAA